MQTWPRSVLTLRTASKHVLLVSIRDAGATLTGYTLCIVMQTSSLPCSVATQVLYRQASQATPFTGLLGVHVPLLVSSSLYRKLIIRYVK